MLETSMICKAIALGKWLEGGYPPNMNIAMFTTRVLIAGGPRVGKTTLANKLVGSGLIGGPLRHTDSLIPMFAWSDLSSHVATWFDLQGPWVIEGVAVGRALRKWLQAHPVGAPADIIYWSSQPYIPLIGGKKAMWKGVNTVWNEIKPELLRRNVKVLPFPG